MWLVIMCCWITIARRGCITWCICIRKDEEVFPREKKQLKTIVLFLYVSNVVIENFDSEPVIKQSV
jgi:hypothetical protein